MMPAPKNCPKYLPADNPQRINRDLYILTEAAKGTPQTQIAEAVNLSQPTIATILSDEQAQKKLNEIIKLHISESPDIQKQLIAMAKGQAIDHNGIIKTTLDEEGKTIALSIDPGAQLKAISEHNKIIGISSSHASQIIMNMMQLNIIGQPVPDIIQQWMDSRSKPIEADYTEL